MSNADAPMEPIATELLPDMSSRPSDRMLIDALCISAAVNWGAIDLLKLTASQLGVVIKAREIVAVYAKMAIERIVKPKPLTEEERRARLEASEYEIYQRPEDGSPNAGLWSVMGDAGSVGMFEIRRKAENYVLGIDDEDDAPPATHPDSVAGKNTRGGEFTTTSPFAIDSMRRAFSQHVPIWDQTLAEWLGPQFDLPVEGRRYRVIKAEDLKRDDGAWTFGIAEVTP